MIPSGYRVLPMGEGDLEEVSELERRTFDAPWTRDSFLHEVRENRYARNCVVRDGDDQLAAYACVYLLDEDLLINNIAVAPTHRSRGVGRGLLRHVLEIGRAARCRRALLEVRPSNKPARGLYRGLGFRRLGVRRRYYGDGEDAWVLVRSL